MIKKEETMKAIGARIKEARMKQGLTQTDVSKSVGKKSPAFLAFVEKGKRNISVIDLIKVSMAVCVSLSWLVGEAQYDVPKRKFLKKFVIKDEEGVPVSMFSVKF